MSLALALFALVAFVDAMSNTTQCPKGCNCYPYTVRCGYYKDNVEQLTGQSFSFLSANHFMDHLTSLYILNTSTTRVPASICQLLNLRVLNLDGNNFTELPDNCFRKLTKLQSLSLSGNSITSLHDGTFDGLRSLQTLNLSHNHIAFIGLRVFSNATNLTSLSSLDVSYNKLTSLEPWWYYRCIVGSIWSPVVINLSHNLISKFTNKLQINFGCIMKIAFGKIDLGFNPVVHVVDIFSGWNIRPERIFKCLDFVRIPFIVPFYVSGLNLACDCTDYEVFKYAKNIQLFRLLKVLQGIRCSYQKFNIKAGQTKLNNSLNFIDFVCNLSDRCPPSCQCVYRPDNATLHVYCSAANLSSLPLDLPPLPKSDVKYKLDFSNNKLLRRLEHRLYFVNTSILDVSNCSLTEITMEDLQDVSNFSVANFRGNLLQSFPKQADTVNISAKLLLGLNPWRCSCDNSWMIQWLQSLSDQIVDPGDIICTYPTGMYGRNVLKSNEGDFCPDPVQHNLAITVSTQSTVAPGVAVDWKIAFSIIAAVSAVFVILITFGLLFYKLREKCYKRWNFHPFDRDECVGEDMEYDVFLCCSSENHNPHGLRILELMESNGYRVCYHLRDFLAGAAIAENMIQSIERSKRTICLISNNFLQR